MPRIRLEPLGLSLEAPDGMALADLLFVHGVEFPCGGRSRCLACRVRVAAGSLPPSDGDRAALTPAQLAEGWRLSCTHRVVEGLTLHLARYEAAILADDSAFAFTPRAGCGIAVDLGTTTMVAQLVDLAAGRVLGVASALNPQARHGADVVTRLEAASNGLADELRRLAHAGIGALIAELTPRATAEIAAVTVVGNTAMHHLFLGLPCAGLARQPFEPADVDGATRSAAELDWPLAPDTPVRFLPCLGGFVGSDILAGVLATRMAELPGVNVLLDLGTNGEIVVGGRDGMVTTSTAAGPAFEGARIRCGMRAATGAIAHAAARDGRLQLHVIGGGPARGLCGSGLVDVVAGALDLGLLQPGGRLTAGTLALADGVELVQKDVRELQLAKGAIAAGVRVLLDHLGAEPEQVARVFLAGAFGNAIDARSAHRIGLVAFPPERIEPVGNTALLGAKLALFADDPAFAALRARIAHVPLKEDRAFLDRYVEGMVFPD